MARTQKEIRIRKDAFGVVSVPKGVFYDKETARWGLKFGVGEPLPFAFISALALVKKACAYANRDCGVIPRTQAKMIGSACDEIIAGKHTEQFPVSIFQSGSGTYTNMNMNEVIARIAHVRSGGLIDDEVTVLHPNDIVNRSQSTNDIFPTAMYVSSVLVLKSQVIPAASALVAVFREKGEAFKDVIKAGRTHLMDAVPIRLGMEFDGWGTRIQRAEKTIARSLENLSVLPVGGTALGSGINAPDGFAEKAAAYISEFTGHAFTPAPNKFVDISSHDPVMEASSAISNLALVLDTVTTSIRWLASGPRTGLGELKMPTSEPGSSIMPGKVNPSVLEAVRMACNAVEGKHETIRLANRSSEQDMNTGKPVMAATFLESAELLTTACTLLHKKCIVGITADKDVIQNHLDNTLMTVTSLTPEIGYAKAAQIAVHALNENITLREAAMALGVSARVYDTTVDPKKMVKPFTSGIKRSARKQ
ncbi:MAG TPA: class II fumarate hydratase [Candidatus Acidoferrales bacterium]|nr:class II fumarate hydratase [Candidatus Acidoferrales bacterium]